MNLETLARKLVLIFSGVLGIALLIYLKIVWNFPAFLIILLIILILLLIFKSLNTELGIQNGEVTIYLSNAFLIGFPFLPILPLYGASIIHDIKEALFPPPPPPPGLFVEGSPMGIFALVFAWIISAYGFLISGLFLRYRAGRLKNKSIWTLINLPYALILLILIAPVLNSSRTLRHDDYIMFLGGFLLASCTGVSTHSVLNDKRISTFLLFFIVLLYTITPFVMMIFVL
jgi:hypothetical protein